MNVLIYSGPGSAQRSCYQAVSFVSQLYGDSLQLVLADSELVRSGRWRKNTNLFVMPGGATTPAHQALGYRGLRHIRKFVRSGGRYAGYCAGGYFGCTDVEFAKGDPSLERITKRELGFFAGIGRGPVYSGFAYGKDTGVHAVPITRSDDDTQLAVLFNGGCSFHPHDSWNQTEILATYSEREDNAAVIVCNVGDGKALLSGVHFEFGSNSLIPDNDRLISVVDRLRRGNNARLAFGRAAMAKLMG